MFQFQSGAIKGIIVAKTRFQFQSGAIKGSIAVSSPKRPAKSPFQFQSGAIKGQAWYSFRPGAIKGLPGLAVSIPIWCD